MLLDEPLPVLPLEPMPEPVLEPEPMVEPLPVVEPVLPVALDGDDEVEPIVPLPVVEPLPVVLPPVPVVLPLPIVPEPVVPVVLPLPVVPEPVVPVVLPLPVVPEPLVLPLVLGLPGCVGLVTVPGVDGEGLVPVLPVVLVVLLGLVLCAPAFRPTATKAAAATAARLPMRDLFMLIS